MTSELSEISTKLVKYLFDKYDKIINKSDITSILESNCKIKKSRNKTNPYNIIYSSIKSPANIDVVHVCDYNFINVRTGRDKPKKIIAFDFDDTLISKSNCLLPNVLETLYEYAILGYAFVIFSNQKRLKMETIKRRFDIFINLLSMYHDKFTFEYNLQIIGYFSLSDDVYRKPKTGMYDLFCNTFPYLEVRYFVGDACGRIGDFSDSDIKFSSNCELDFKTSQEFFSIGKILQYDSIVKKVFKQPTVIFLIGYPASGKSTVAQKFKNVEIVNNDTMGKNSITNFKKYIKDVKNIVVDNLNYNLSQRQKFLELIPRDIYKVVYIYLNKSYDYSKHFNSLREKPVPCVVFNAFRKNYERPLRSEYDYIYSIL